MGFPLMSSRSANGSPLLCSCAYQASLVVRSTHLPDVLGRRVLAVAEACDRLEGQDVDAAILDDGFVDMDACGKLADIARTAGLEVAFLRTFDLLTDRRRGMLDLSTLCMKRVVTAGVLGWDASVSTLEQRIAVLAEDARNAENFAISGKCVVEIIPGGGVRATNARDFMQVSPHLHASCRRGGRINHDELKELKIQMTLAITSPMK